MFNRKLFARVYARSDSNDTDAVMTGGAYIGWRIADCADGSILTGESAGLYESAIVDVGPRLEAVAERVEVEVSQQAAGLEFDRADCRKVSGSDAE